MASNYVTNCNNTSFVNLVLLNEGEMVIKWDRKLKNKGNAILSGLAA